MEKETFKKTPKRTLKLNKEYSQKDIEKIYNLSISSSNKKKASRYIKGQRGLRNTNIGYILNEQDYKIHNSLVIPLHNIFGKVAGVELRSLDEEQVRYNKLYSNKLYIPLYGFPNKHTTSNYVILTEGVFDTLSLIELGYNSVTGLRASVSSLVLHYMAIFFDKIIIAFDNDSAGRNGTKKIYDFYNKYYSDIEIDILDIDYSLFDVNTKDINDIFKLFKDKGKKYLKEVIEETLY